MSSVRRTRIEDYLWAIESICDETGARLAGTGEISQQIGVSKGTASSMLRKMAGDGFIDLIPYEGARLTDTGQRLARRTVRRYRLLELFLSQALGVSWDSVADDAWRMEPGASDELIDRIDSFLMQPEYDHHGDPIQRSDNALPQ